MTDPAAAWIASERRISAPTLAQMPVGSGTAFFPAVERMLPAIGFRYPCGGFKCRAYPDKEFVATKGFQMAFWNLTAVLRANPEEIYITEGEFDAVALVEAGIKPGQVLSVPGGAKEKASADPAAQKGYQFVEEALKAGLSRVKRIILLTDGDAPGHALRADLVHIFGPARCWYVDWPEGCKDANDLLRTDGPQVLYELVTAGRLEWPVEGIYSFAELPEQPPLQPWDMGFFDFEKKMRLAPGTWSVVTGHPGHGKTVFWQQVWFQIAQRYDERIAIYSAETRAKPHLRRHLRTFYWGKLERDLSAQEIKQADAWINEHYRIIQHPDDRPTLKWIMDTAEVACVRYGCRVVVIDPFNRIESQRPPGMSETDYIGECLREVHRFSRDMLVHFQILAHPAKGDQRQRGVAPALEDIAGSKHWDNMADQGFVVHRPGLFDGERRRTDVQIFCRKARFEELGYPCVVKMKFDLELGCYVAADLERPGTESLI